MKIILITIYLIFSSFLQADDKVKGTKGVEEEFMKAEEYLQSRKVSPFYRKATIEKNILSAIKSYLQRKIPSYESGIYKELEIKNVAYEPEKGTLNYFAKYKEYLFYFMYYTDPEFYLQLPIESRVYTVPTKGDKMVEDFHQSNQPK
jgi:hypothetical protein